ncbi:armadillo-type protein [Mycena leptocephala]|nr:armadillo-type protein [Mycena leptocephala]
MAAPVTTAALVKGSAPGLALNFQCSHYVAGVLPRVYTVGGGGIDYRERGLPALEGHCRNIDKLSHVRTHANLGHHLTAVHGFRYKDILPSTRMFVLDHLTIRARKTEEEAQTIVEGRAPDCALELLRSSDVDILRITCNMLESIARRKGLSITIVKLGLCKAIVSLFGHSNIDIQSSAIQAFDCVLKGSASEDAARAAVDSKALKHLLQVLKINPGTLKLEIPVCSIFCSIAQFRLFHGALLQLDLCASLVSLLHRWRTRGPRSKEHPILEFHPLIQYHDPQHIHPIYTHKEIFPPETFGHDAKDEPILLRNVLYALASLCQSEEGAWAVVVLGFWIRPRILPADLFLLRHQSAVVRKEAIHTLSCISAGSQEGAEAVLDALQSFSVRLQSPNFGVVRWTCWVLSEIVEYPSLTAALLRIDPCKQLFWLLRQACYKLDSWKISDVCDYQGTLRLMLGRMQTTLCVVSKPRQRKLRSLSQRRGTGGNWRKPAASQKVPLPHGAALKLAYFNSG